MTLPVKKELINILIVDDDEKHLETLKIVLSKLDVQCFEVNSGQAALGLLLRHEFMLILLDVKMPIMDGFETAKLIRENKSSKHIPIIFMTAYDRDEFRINEGYKLGAIDYLFKPINQDILVSKVDTFLRFFIQEKDNLRNEKEREREKEKEREYKELVSQLEEKNQELQRSQLAALNMMEDANEVRRIIEKSEILVKMQAKDLEQFAYTATHDIKAPINNIESCLTILKQDKDIKEETSLKTIEWMDKSVDQCKKLIRHLVTVVKVKGESNHKFTKINLNELLKTVENSLHSEIEGQKVSISCDLSKTEFVDYSEPHLESMVLNLLSNAIKYRSPDRPPEIKITTAKLKKYTTLSVKDNGLGLDVERDKAKVFGLFKRAHKDIEGTGMGLYLVNETLKKLGGKMRLQSKLGEGSTFTAYFRNGDNNGIHMKS